MIRLIVHGARGRMGTRIVALAQSDVRFDVVARMPPDAEPAARPVDVVVDFSSPDGAERAVDLAVAHRAALLVGTTGLSAQNLRRMGDAARSIPVMIAPNTALGVAVARRLALLAHRLLGPSFDVDLVEKHHRGKRDAPSGTAARIATDLREAGAALPDDRIHVIRAGDIVGEHAVNFSGSGEIVTVAHAATSRDVFAAGALRAAAWLVTQSPGRYAIEDCLGMEDEAGAADGRQGRSSGGAETRGHEGTA